MLFREAPENAKHSWKCPEALCPARGTFVALQEFNRPSLRVLLHEVELSDGCASYRSTKRGTKFKRDTVIACAMVMNIKAVPGHGTFKLYLPLCAPPTVCTSYCAHFLLCTCPTVHTTSPLVLTSPPNPPPCLPSSRPSEPSPSPVLSLARPLSSSPMFFQSPSPHHIPVYPRELV